MNRVPEKDITKSVLFKRKLYHKAKNYNWRVRTVESILKTNLIRCSKEYKKVLNTQFHLYTFINKLRGLKQTDSKYYWSLINRTCSNENKQKIVKNVSLNCFFGVRPIIRQSDSPTVR